MIEIYKCVFAVLYIIWMSGGGLVVVGLIVDPPRLKNGTRYRPRLFMYLVWFVFWPFMKNPWREK